MFSSRLASICPSLKKCKKIWLAWSIRNVRIWHSMQRKFTWCKMLLLLNVKQTIRLYKPERREGSCRPQNLPFPKSLPRHYASSVWCWSDLGTGGFVCSIRNSLERGQELKRFFFHGFKDIFRLIFDCCELYIYLTWSYLFYSIFCFVFREDLLILFFIIRFLISNFLYFIVFCFIDYICD